MADNFSGNPDPTDPYQREAQTFPQLSDEQIGRIKRFGALADAPAGFELFTRGERSVDFFVVVTGDRDHRSRTARGRDGDPPPCRAPVHG